MVTVLKLCARCGETLRAWLEDVREGMPGAEKVEHGMFEDHAPREEIDWGRVKGEFSDQFLPPKHPTVTESRTDRRPSPETAADGSSSPPVASKSWYLLPTWSKELYGWSGLD